MDEALYHEMLALEEHHWWFVAKHNIMMHLINRFLHVISDRKPTACDIGCGCGGFLGKLAQRFEAVGLESSPIARGFCLQRRLDVRNGMLPDEMPFKPQSFDVIILSDVLEHVEQDFESVKAATSLLRVGGLLVCTVPAHPWMYTARDAFHHHVRRYDRLRFESLFDCPSLKPLVCSFYNITLFPAMVAARLGKKLLRIDKEAPDVRVLPDVCNTPLRWLFEMEKHYLTHLRSPLGASLISVHRAVDLHGDSRQSIRA